MSTARVDFTRGAADRIARVVRLVEQGDRGQSGPTWESVNETMPAGLKLATFTGNWEIGTFKTVALYGVANTARVLNLCTPAVGFSTAQTSETRFVIFGKVKYTTDPVVVEIQARPTNTTNTACVLTLGGVDLSTIAGYSATDIQLLGHNTTGPCLQWYGIATCATATSA